ncbi:MAG: ATP-binding cassette domain-containing protein [Candidatus Krumholzibacteria bacterium]
MPERGPIERKVVAASPLVQIRDVTKAFNGTRAVDGISLSIKKGSIYGLLGPNGAGKTTLIRMIMRIIYPDTGDIQIFGLPLTEASKDRIGYLPEERGVYRKMKVLDLLTFFGEIKSMKRTDARSVASEWLERLNLADVAQKKAEELSKGMQQKVQFIATVMHSPELIILDEPFTGLDPKNADVLKDIMLEFHRKGHTIIFSTHMMDQVEKLCQRICLIDKGKEVLEGTLRSIKKKYGHNAVTIRFEGDGAFLRELPEVESVNDRGNELFLRLRDGSDPQKILAKAARKVAIHKFEISEPSIHDIFIEQVSG